MNKIMNKAEAVSLGGNLLLTLCKLSEYSVSKGEISCTTRELAAKLNCSQQTASRHLIELERRGLVRRLRVAKQESIHVTPKGLNLLSGMYFALKRVFERLPDQLYFEGELFSGLGEGSYYIGQEGYRRQLKEKVGFDPFPGTLNVRLKPGFESEKRILEALPLVSIEGFKGDRRSFGPAKCARALINDNVEAAIILALRSHYGPDVIEIVSGENLRKKIRLRDGDTVRVRVVTSAPQRSFV